MADQFPIVIVNRGYNLGCPSGILEDHIIFTDNYTSRYSSVADSVEITHTQTQVSWLRLHIIYGMHTFILTAHIHPTNLATHTKVNPIMSASGMSKGNSPSCGPGSWAPTSGSANFTDCLMVPTLSGAHPLHTHVQCCWHGRYGVCFMSVKSDLCSTAVNYIDKVMSWYIAPC